MIGTVLAAYRRKVQAADWDLPDPAGLDLGAVRPIRDE
jgi:hypothetical protein